MASTIIISDHATPTLPPAKSIEHGANTSGERVLEREMSHENP
jgi:hypothetical protein